MNSSTSSTPIPNGTYYILSSLAPICVTLTNGTLGAPLTAWACQNGENQQWIVSSNGENLYTFQNVEFNTFIVDANTTYISPNGPPTPGGPASWSWMSANSTPMAWQIFPRIGGFLVVDPGNPQYSWNLDNSGTTNDTPILTWPYPASTTVDNSAWSFQAIPSDSTSTGSPSIPAAATVTTSFTPSSPSNPVHPNHKDAIIGGSVGGVVLLIIAVIVAPFVYKYLTQTCRGIRGTDHPKTDNYISGNNPGMR